MPHSFKDSDFYKQYTLPRKTKKGNLARQLPAAIGPYKIEALLNQGSMSLLYLGKHTSSAGLHVIKVLSPEYLDHPEMVDHFLQEAKIIGMTNHPNIVKLFHYGQWEGGVYIAMEFIRGVSLKQFITQHSFSLKKALELILQVAYALCHLHAHGVAHRDLKPENVLITEAGTVKVIDFGISQLHDDNSQIKESSLNVMGTPSYMSPEQKKNPQKASFSSDLYALGVVTYELVLGRLSFGLINTELLPRGLKKIVDNLLATDLQKRYADIVDFITDLTAYYKSPELEKERMGGNLVMEMMETIQEAEQNFFGHAPPPWKRLECAFYENRSMGKVGGFHSFHSLDEERYLIITAHTTSQHAHLHTHISIYKGLLEGLLHTIPHASPTFLQTLANEMNHLVWKMYQGSVTFTTSLLLLDPAENVMKYLGAGTCPIQHFPHEQIAVKAMLTKNPMIGAQQFVELEIMEDHWRPGSTIILQNLQIHLMKTLQDWQETVNNELVQSKALSMSALIKELVSLSSNTSELFTCSYPFTLIAVHRIT